MTQNETEKTTSLTDRQLAALPHIAASSTLSQAARSASTSRATLYRWLQDERFRQALDSLRSEAADFARAELQGLMLKGILVLSQAMDDSSPDIRLRAARATLYLALKVKDIKDIQQRLELIDEAFALRASKGFPW